MPTPLVSIKLGHDAIRTMATVARMVANADVAVQKCVRRVADALAKEVKEGIERQSFPLAPDSPRWARYKAEHGLDNRVLIATHEYIDSIHVVEAGKSVSIEANGLANWLEYGTSKMPPRPHWQPAMQKMSKTADKFAKEILRDLLGT